MASILDDIEVILSDGDLEVFRRWVEAKLESKDNQITHLFRKIQNLESRLNELEQKVDCKVDIGRFEYEMEMRYEN